MATAEATARGDVRPRTARLALAAILLLALALRVVYVLQSRGNPFFAAPEMDALYHVQWATALARGEEFQPGPFFRAPGYPWFLAACLRVFGEGLLAPRLVQAVLGTVACALVYLVGARAFDRRTGLVAAALAAAYWMLIYFDGELLLPVLEVPTSLAAILLALRFAERPTPLRAAWAGVALGAAALVRPNILLWAPLVALWMLFRAGRPTRAAWGAVLAYVLAAFAPILPVTAYNTLAGGDLVLISSQGGVNLWIGNNPASDGSTAIAPGTRPDWWGGYHDTIAQAEAEAGRALKPSEVSGHYTRKALSWMAANPLDAARHFAWKLRLFWTDWELGNNQDEVFFALRFGPVLRWLPVGFGWTAPLGLLGLALALRRWRAIGPLWLFVPAWCASVVAFFVCARFRIPMVPALLVFAAFALTWSLDRWRERRWRPLGLALVSAAVLAFLVQAVPAAVDRTPAKGLWQLGIRAAASGDPARAVEFYRESLAHNPRFAIAHQDLGIALDAIGQPEAAERSLREALRLAPSLAGARQALTEQLLARGRTTEALGSAQAGVTAAPLASAAHYALARVLLARGEAQGAAAVPEAEHTLRRALELARTPDETFNAAFALAEIARRSGRAAEAVRAYERALDARPAPDAAGWWLRCQEGRLAALAQAGEIERARSLARDLAARHAADARILRALRPYLGG